MYLLKGYLNYLNIKIVSTHMEKEILLTTGKNKMLSGNSIQCSYYFLDLQTIFLSMSLSTYSYQYLNSMCFTYADLYKI